MTTLTMRYLRGHFVVTAPDIEPVIFKSRREARDWCAEHHPGSPIREIGANSSKRAAKPKHHVTERPGMRLSGRSGGSAALVMALPSPATAGFSFEGTTRRSNRRRYFE